MENPENAPALEMTLLGGTFVFTDDSLIALSGSDFGATVDGSPLPNWTASSYSPRTNPQGWLYPVWRALLSCRWWQHLPVEPFLRSASTHILSHLGGIEGRQLRKGDDAARFGAKLSRTELDDCVVSLLKLPGNSRHERCYGRPLLRRQAYFPPLQSKLFYKAPAIA